MAADAASRGNYRRTASFADGADRIFAWHQVPGSELFALIGLDVNTVLAPLETGGEGVPPRERSPVTRGRRVPRVV